jgi:sigma-54 dependent transcriptional regulator, acetoin dehydrogenase operon transcriptional activator AcoR
METLPSKTSPENEAEAARPFLTVAFDGDNPFTAASRHDLSAVDEVVVGRGDVRSAVRTVVGARRRLTIALANPRVSQTHARIVRRVHDWFIEDAGSSNGTRVGGERSAGPSALASGDLIELGHTFLVFKEYAVEGPVADPDVVAVPRADGLVSLAPPLESELARLPRVAGSAVSIVIHGETGTGKEIVARGIHSLSRRRGPFVAFNAAAIAPSLLETELFGYRKGAFSGATDDRPGLLRAAHGGTLFLDEAAELAPAAQAALLRALQEREVLPVGATAPVPIDVRVVSASHRSLDALVAEGKFRADLLARLRGYAIDLPPLRERAEDMGVVIATLLERLGRDRVATVSFSSRAARALMYFEWPLNVRQLEKAIESALVLAGLGVIDLASLPADVAGAAPRDRARTIMTELSPADLARREQLVSLLQQHDGNVSAVARAMGKARVQVQRWIRRYGLDVRR